MLNLLRFREMADYSATPELAPPSPISGEAAYQLYIEHTRPHLERSGGSLLFMGRGGSYLIGPSDERWDAVLLVRQRSVADFMAFASDRAYLAGIGHRTAALEDSRLLPLEAGRADRDELEDFVRRYLAALASGVTGEALAAFYDPEVIQEELPNRLNPAGVKRDLAAILAGAESGARLLGAQTFDVLGLVTDGSGMHAGVEVAWSGTLAVPMATLPAGFTLRARFAFFIVMRGGRIVAQRNYDCFEPF